MVFTLRKYLKIFYFRHTSIFSCELMVILKNLSKIDLITGSARKYGFLFKTESVYKIQICITQVYNQPCLKEVLLLLFFFFFWPKMYTSETKVYAANLIIFLSGWQWRAVNARTIWKMVLNWYCIRWLFVCTAWSTWNLSSSSKNSRLDNIRYQFMTVIIEN